MRFRLPPLLSLLLLVVWCAPAAVGRPRGWSPDTIPNPAEDPNGCGLLSHGMICDPDGVLRSSNRKKVSKLLDVIESETQHECGESKAGHQVAVVLVERIASGYHPNWNNIKRAEQFAIDIGSKWGVGHEDCNDGIVVVASKLDRAVFIKTADGLAKTVLPDPHVNYIIGQTTERFKKDEGDLNEGIHGAASLIFYALKHPQEMKLRHPQEMEEKVQGSFWGPIPFWGPILVNFLIIVFFLGYFLWPWSYVFCVGLFLAVAYPLAYIWDKLNAQWNRNIDAENNNVEEQHEAGDDEIELKTVEGKGEKKRNSYFYFWRSRNVTQTWISQLPSMSTAVEYAQREVARIEANARTNSSSGSSSRSFSSRRSFGGGGGFSRGGGGGRSW